jgi:hypothetical protein
MQDMIDQTLTVAARHTAAVYNPNAAWEPLIRLVGQSKAASFMYMGQVKGIRQFKHNATRRYLNLDPVTLQCYRYDPRGYQPIPEEEALRHVYS